MAGAEAAMAGAETAMAGQDGRHASIAARPPGAEIVASLPVPQVDSADPAAGYLATHSTLDPEQRTAAQSTSSRKSP